MTFTALASSSHGNCYIVDDGKTKILLECGIAFKRIRKNVNLANVRGCLLSHEHGDHSKAVRELIKSGVPVYASQGTAAELNCTLITPVKAGVQFQIDSMEIMPFRTKHDTREPFGFLIYSHQDGERLAFATDTGNLSHSFPGVNLLALEANYDKNLLALCERLPVNVRLRIIHNHMEISTLCKYLQSLDLSSCRAVYLLHLSRAAGNAEDFVQRVRSVVPPGVEVIACEE